MTNRPVSPRRGFSLVELMVVVAIIGMLASIVAYSVSGARPQAERSKAMADLKSMRNAILFYKSDTGEYPEELEDLHRDPGVDGWGQSAEGAAYLLDPPRDPWNRMYVFYPNDPRGSAPFNLATLGRDGQEGGEGSDEDVWLHEPWE